MGKWRKGWKNKLELRERGVVGGGGGLKGGGWGKGGAWTIDSRSKW